MAMAIPWRFQAQLSAYPAAQEDASARMLVAARQLLKKGKPSQSLQAVVTTINICGGEGVVARILARVYRNKVQASSEADKLASLFAECAIAEAQPQNAEAQPQNVEPFSVPVQSSLPNAESDDACQASILAESGRKQIMLDASIDGSSFICLQCGGLVSSNRRDEHYAYWRKM